MEVIWPEKHKINRDFKKKAGQTVASSLLTFGLLGILTMQGLNYNYERIQTLYRAPGVRETFMSNLALKSIKTAQEIQPDLIRDFNTNKIEALESKVKIGMTTPEYRRYVSAEESRNDVNKIILGGLIIACYLNIKMHGRRLGRLEYERACALEEIKD